MHRRVINRQTASGSGSPWPPTGFGYGPVSYAHTLFLVIPEQSPPATEAGHPFQQARNPNGCTDVHSKLLFLYFKALQQDAELKKHQTNKKKPQPSKASSQQWAIQFLYFRFSFKYAVMWTFSILYLLSTSLSRHLTLPLPLLLPSHAPCS